MMRVIDDDGIRIGNVYTAFYDVGTYQYIVFAIYKIEDHFFQLMTFQLSVSGGNSQIRTKALYQSGRLPAPRISRSRMEIWKPLPSSLCCSSVCNRLRLSAGKVLMGDLD